MVSVISSGVQRQISYEYCLGATEYQNEKAGDEPGFQLFQPRLFKTGSLT